MRRFSEVPRCKGTRFSGLTHTCQFWCLHEIFRNNFEIRAQKKKWIAPMDSAEANLEMHVRSFNLVQVLLRYKLNYTAENGLPMSGIDTLWSNAQSQHLVGKDSRTVQPYIGPVSPSPCFYHRPRISLAARRVGACHKLARRQTMVNSFRVASRGFNDRWCGNCIEKEVSVNTIDVKKVGNGYSRKFERKSLYGVDWYSRWILFWINPMPR